MSEGGTFAEAFERLRLSRGLSPADLAREMHEYEGNVSRWRHGGGIDILKVRKVADFFGVDPAWLEGLAGYQHATPRNPANAKSVNAVNAELDARLARMGAVLGRYPRVVWLAVMEANERMIDALAAQAPNNPADAADNNPAGPKPNRNHQDRRGPLSAGYALVGALAS